MRDQMRVKSTEIDLLQAGTTEQPVAFDPARIDSPVASGGYSLNCVSGDW
jgi:hypothetical protein